LDIFWVNGKNFLIFFIIFMNLSKEVEDKLIVFVRGVFANDEHNFRHTLSCVRSMKELVSKEGGDEKVLVSAIYLHDIGYSDFFSGKHTMEQRIAAKKAHMGTGAIKAKNFLEGSGDFSPDEISEIVHLVNVHDIIESTKSHDEQLVFEADSLGGVDSWVGVTFNEEEFGNYVQIFEARRAPRFVTRTGKELLKKFAHENELYQRSTKLFKK
jgi:hypothetical protein